MTRERRESRSPVREKYIRSSSSSGVGVGRVVEGILTKVGLLSDAAYVDCYPTKPEPQVMSK